MGDYVHFFCTLVYQGLLDIGYNTNSCLIWKESLTDTHSFAIFKWPYSAHSVRQHNEQLSYPAAIFLPIVCHVFSCLNVFCCLCSSFAHLTRVNSCGAATQTTPTSVKPRKGHLSMGPSVHLEKWVCLLDLHTINHDQHYKGTTRKKAGGDGSCSAQMLLSQLLAGLHIITHYFSVCKVIQ